MGIDDLTDRQLLESIWQQVVELLEFKEKLEASIKALQEAGPMGLMSMMTGR